MPWWTWLLWSVSALLGLAAAFTLYRALFHDRSRGRRRCPRCWYDMAGLAGLQCPECGRQARRERSLLRTRRRWWRAGLGLLLALLAYVNSLVPRAISSGSAWNAVPTPALVVLLQFYDTEGDQVFQSVQGRMFGPTAKLSKWEKLLVARHCARVLREPDAPITPPAAPPVAPVIRTGNRDGPVSPPPGGTPQLIAPGDPVTITIWDIPDEGRKVQYNRVVDDQGFVHLPHIGDVIVGGQTEADALKTVKMMMEPLVARPRAAVELDSNAAAVSASQVTFYYGFASKKHAEAMRLLQTLGADARPAVPVLVTLIDDPASPQRAAAIELVGNIGPAARPAAIALGRALSDPSVREAALVSLDRLGKSAGPAIPALEKLLNTRADLFSLIRAGRLLHRLIPDRESVPLFRAMLRSPTYLDRVAGARCLEAVGPGARIAIPDILRITREPPEPLKSTGVSILATFGADAAPALAELVDSPDDDIARPAAYWLISLHANAAAAVPALTRGLSRSDARVRGYSAQALASAGAADALPALRALSADPDPWVRQMAAEAADAIEQRR